MKINSSVKKCMINVLHLNNILKYVQISNINNVKYKIKKELE